MEIFCAFSDNLTSNFAMRIFFFFPKVSVRRKIEWTPAAISNTEAAQETQATTNDPANNLVRTGARIHGSRFYSGKRASQIFQPIYFHKNNAKEMNIFCFLICLIFRALCLVHLVSIMWVLFSSPTELLTLHFPTFSAIFPNFSDAFQSFASELYSMLF